MISESPELRSAIFSALAACLGLSPDQILFQGKTWRVVSLRPWTAFGFSRALAVEMPTDL